MNSKPKGIAIYIKVSTEKQDKNNSKDSQLTSIKKHLASIGWDSIKSTIYSDTHSASITSKKIDNIDDYQFTSPNMFLRDGLRSLIYDATQKKFDKLIVYSHDRLSRDVHEGLIIKHTLKKLGVEIIYSKNGEQINSKNEAFNNFFENIISNLTALESSILASRVTLGSSYNIKNNIWAGGTPPYGYKLTPIPASPKRSKLEVNPSEANIVKLIFNFYVNCYRPKDIADYIKKEYIFNKDRHWTENSIKSILNNPVYLGKLVWNKKGGRRNPVKRPSDKYVYSKQDESLKIIETETWNKSVLLRNLQDTNPKFLSTGFLLQGILICKKCGSTLITKNHGNTTGRVYFCKHNNSLALKTLTIKADTIHTIIFNEFQNIYNLIINDSCYFNNFYCNYLEQFNNKNNQLLSKKVEVEKNLTDCNNIINKCTSKLSELSNTKSLSFSKLLTNSICEVKTTSQLAKENLENSLTELNLKLKNTTPYDKIQFKNLIVKNLDSICSIFNDDNSTLNNRKIRLLIYETIDNISISDINEIEISFK